MSVHKCKSCDKDCSAKNKLDGENDKDFAERQDIQRRMCQIEHKLLILSGKGGVGKSTVAANLAAALSEKGNKVGLIDVDIHGPSIPKMLGLENSTICKNSQNLLLPVNFNCNLKVMSVSFFLKQKDDALIWRGPMKMSIIKQFLKDVEWGDLDYLIFDLPPGTGDEPLSICQLIDKPEGAIVVTTPQEISINDVRKSINFCKILNLPILGVVENMSGFVCPHCNRAIDIFTGDGTLKMAEEMGVKLLGKIPLNPDVVNSGDTGKPFVINKKSLNASNAFQNIINSLKF